MTFMRGLPVVVGGGLAGLSAVLAYDGPSILAVSGRLGEETASGLAQGGIAAAIGAGDTIESHAADTHAAGAGLCDPDAVMAITSAGPATIRALEGAGVVFDRDGSGRLDLHLEAAHRHARIAHAGGDRTGAAIVAALVARVRETPRIVVMENHAVCGLDVHDGRLRAVHLHGPGGMRTVETALCAIATGGIGSLWAGSTTPAGNRGSGLAAAARAGAVLADMEFVQFHPTALDVPSPATGGWRPLVSEAVRGAGALLVDETGARFTDELAPRDVVSRAIAAHRTAGHHVFLDARMALGERFSAHFPGIAAACLSHGIDPARMPIPVSPAVHYHMGGIRTDHSGRSSIEGLSACGEAACTGLHGANRLASNSLLEAFVTGEAVGHEWSGRALRVPPASGPGSRLPVDASPSATQEIGRLMSRHAGILRDAAGLKHLLADLVPHADRNDDALVGALVAMAALRREESRGSHHRLDFPHEGNAFPRTMTIGDLSSCYTPSMEFIS